jgi:hypothetical protein
MYFSFNGFFAVDELEKLSLALSDLLQAEGLDTLSDVSVSFLGWRGKERCQIVDPDGFVTTISTNWEEVGRTRGSSKVQLHLPAGITIRDRPQDLEWSPLAVLARRDD